MRRVQTIAVVTILVVLSACGNTVQAKLKASDLQVRVICSGWRTQSWGISANTCYITAKNLGGAEGEFRVGWDFKDGNKMFGLGTSKDSLGNPGYYSIGANETASFQTEQSILWDTRFVNPKVENVKVSVPWTPESGD